MINIQPISYCDLQLIFVGASALSASALSANYILAAAALHASTVPRIIFTAIIITGTRSGHSRFEGIYALQLTFGMRF
jgi:hypothetical protein